MKNLEAAAPGDREIRALDLAEHRGLLPGPQRRDRLHPAAVFVSERQAVKKVFDGDETGAFQVRGLARPHALQELKGRAQLDAHCTTTASPWATSISRMFAGSGNGASRRTPSGCSGVRE